MQFFPTTFVVLAMVAAATATGEESYPAPYRKLPTTVIGSSHPVSPSSAASSPSLHFATNHKNNNNMIEEAEQPVAMPYRHDIDQLDSPSAPVPSSSSSPSYPSYRPYDTRLRNRFGLDESDNAIITEPLLPPKNELGILDSVFGDGTWSRILESIYKWFAERVKANPGCVERFVCETYRTGENMEGIPYLIMKVTNNAVAYSISEMFDRSIDIKEITRAARFGRTVGTCDTMQCAFADGQIRTVTDYFNLDYSFDDFMATIVSSVRSNIGF
jgi:hypothetical protein